MCHCDRSRSSDDIAAVNAVDRRNNPMVLTRKEKLEQIIKKLKSQGVKIDWAVRIRTAKEDS
jgi:uncharacterized protein (UPF0128 family)